MNLKDFIGKVKDVSGVDEKVSKYEKFAKIAYAVLLILLIFIAWKVKRGN